MQKFQRKQRNILYRSVDFILSMTPLKRNPVTTVKMGVSVGLDSSIPKELLQSCSLPGALPVLWMCFHTSKPAGILGPPLFPGKHDRKTSRQANRPGAFQYFLSVGVINTQSQMKSS